MLGFRNPGGTMQKGQTDLELGSLLKEGDRVIVNSYSYPDGWWWAKVTEIEKRETHVGVDVELETPIRTRVRLSEQPSYRGRHPQETFTVYPITPRILHLIEQILDKKIEPPK